MPFESFRAPPHMFGENVGESTSPYRDEIAMEPPTEAIFNDILKRSNALQQID
jgi:hypothetical protein